MPPHVSLPSVAALVIGVSTVLTPGSPALANVLARSAGITAEATTTTLSEVSSAQAIWGQPVSLTTRVVAKDGTLISGIVDFSDGHRSLGSCKLAAATCVFTANDLDPGNTLITATYRDPQTSFAPSHASAKIQIAPRPTTTAVTANGTAIDFGSQLQLLIVTQPPSPGRVVINDGPVTLANMFTDGSVTFNTSSLAVGSHLLTTAFLGNQFNVGSQDSVTVTVNRDPSQTFLCVSSGRACVTSLRVSDPQSFSLQGHVSSSNSVYTGTMSFYDRGSVIADGTLNPDGTLQESVQLGFGDHFLSAAFSGSDTISDSSSGAVPVAVGPSPTTLSIDQSATVADNQSGVTVTVYVSSEMGAPDGVVTLTDNGNAMATLNLSGGAASIWTHFGWGRHVISAQYSGNQSYQPSSSSTVHFTSISVVYYHQLHELSCEATALQIALSASGNNSYSQDTLLNMVGFDRTPPTYDAQGNFHWGDPYVTFVGNVDGYEGDHWRSPFGAAGDQMTGYGVYYPPIAITAQAAGATVLFAGEGISPNALYDFVNAGHPAEVWLTVGFGSAPYNEYIAFDGRRVPYTAPKDHVLVLIGVTDSQVVLANPVGGYRQMISRASFEYSFTFLHNMAVVLA